MELIMVIKWILLFQIFIISHAVMNLRWKRQTKTVGLACSQNPECGRGAFCNSNKHCECLSTYTDINGYCERKINPDDAGCTYDKQCSAVWPDAYCYQGVCKCGNHQPSFITRDGRICFNYGDCPVNGKYTKYLDAATGAPKSCQFGNDNSLADPYTCWHTHECICIDPECGWFNGIWDGFCCPTRSFACIQPLDSGKSSAGGRPSVTRWYHNSIKGQCEKFQYHGSGGNANNFFTKDQCESYCKQSCERGPPMYSETSYDISPYYPKRIIAYCNEGSFGTTECNGDLNYECATVGTRGTCCPTTAFVCSKYGGIEYPAAPTIFSDSGQELGPKPKAAVLRWFYHSEQKRCRSFFYNGQAGNFNNFLTKDQCTAFCSKALCQAGLPLLDSSGVTNINCASATGCPEKYECQSNVCCPTKQTVCGQPKAAGNCGNFNIRWWFNAAKGNCEEFQYSGCQGNDNNFKTYTDCQSFCRGLGVIPKCIQGEPLQKSKGKYIVCGGDVSFQESCPANFYCYYDGHTYGCCPAKAYTCSQTYSSGVPCGGPIVTRWYYKPDINQCESFSYKGCNGNSNNFATNTDCMEYCGAGGCPNGGEPYRKPNGQFLVCDASIKCPQNHDCMAVSVARKAKRSLCCPSRTYVCRLTKNKGERCSSFTISRYYFNAATRNCELFEYNGCDGNRNNFATKAQCLAYCNSADCPSGQTALIDVSTNQLGTCPSVGGGCADSRFSCIHSDLLRTGICCGSDAEPGSCPSSQDAFIEPFTNQAVRCQPNLDTCPDNYYCWYSSTLEGYFCCGSPTKALCPYEGSPWTNPQTGHPMDCNPTVSKSCSTAGIGYKCEARNVNIGGIISVTGTCCGTPIAQSVCGQGYRPFVFNGIAARCHPRTANVCPPFSICKSNPLQPNEYYCCNRTEALDVNVCGKGKVPLTLDNNPIVCSTGAESLNCPPPYSCILYQKTNTFYCCKIELGAGSCPPGYKVFTVNGEVQRCSPNSVSPCAPGFFCQFDSNEKAYVCCGSESRFPLTTTTMSTTTTTTTSAPPVLPVEICPTGYKPLYSNGIMKMCDPTTLGSCPSRHFCVWNYKQKGYICCGPYVPSTSVARRPPITKTPLPQLPTGCPNNSPSTGICDFAASDCQTGFSCQYSFLRARFQCCHEKKTHDAFGCPYGKSFLFPGTTLPLTCKPDINKCPNGFICLKSLIYSTHQCCSAENNRFNQRTNRY